MRPLEIYIFTTLLGINFLNQVAETASVSAPKAQDLRDIISLKAITSPKQSLLSSLTNPRKAFLQKPSLVEKQKQIQRRDIPFQQTFLGVPVQIENVKQTPNAPAGNLYPQLPKLPPTKPLVKPNETEAERAERIHKSFERLLTFVEIVGQVDNYVSSKWKNLVKTVSNFYETEDETQRVNSKRIYGPCPHAQ